MWGIFWLTGAGFEDGNMDQIVSPFPIQSTRLGAISSKF